MKLFGIIFAALLFEVTTASNNGNVEVFKGWPLIDFAYPTPAARQQAINNGDFIPLNVFLIDIDVDNSKGPQNTRYFVTFPRFAPGIPASLGFLKNDDTKVTPYPSFNWHSAKGANCDNITSVFRVAIDNCNQMWVLDSGKIGEQQSCPPQLLVFNLLNDTLVHRYRFPSSLYYDRSLFLTPILDVKGNTCQDVKVYIADATGFGIVVYDRLTNSSWRTENDHYFPYPSYGKFTIAGGSFHLMDGILGMAISKTPLKSTDTERSLLFHALASGVENAVRLDVLNDAPTWNAYVLSRPDDFSVLGSRNIQTGAEAIDSNGNLWFVLLNPLALACWNTKTAYNTENIKVVYRNDTTLQFSSGMKIVRASNGDEKIYFVTNRLQKYWVGDVSTSEINYRINVGIIKDLLDNKSICNGRSLEEYQDD